MEAIFLALVPSEDQKDLGVSGKSQEKTERFYYYALDDHPRKGVKSAETVESWQERVKEISRGYAPRDVWNEDETGSFWKALPEKSLSEKGKRCRGGKNSMQRVTVAFFVNAAGGKESPVLIGKSKKPRCFSKLKDASHPCGAHYFSNDKAWMRTEIMTDILAKLNTRMKREGRNILMFLDNAPCHPPKLMDMFSNIRVEFLPKNTTSRTQPLDAGIIKTWKVYYRRKLLRYVASQIDVKQCASDVIKSVNLLMAVRWMVSAWEKVKPEVIIKCFKHVGTNPEENQEEEDDDPFSGEELLDLNELVAKVSGETNVDAATYVADADSEALSHEHCVDTGDPNWRRNLRKEIIESHKSTETMQRNDEDDNEDIDQPLSRSEVGSDKDALRLAKQLVEFADWRDEEQLSVAIGWAHDLLCDLQLKSSKQSSLDSFVVKM
ncbi:tigger transposable element-derived protein 6-like [Montipora capricornis]|uniref:tigger transposable element-derived protein 6-like n=1 Tax=Montipora capricornis TaxID=246305 RepID=UPI0035F11366